MAKKTITSDDILGKDAVDPEGEILGVVMKLHIDKDTKQVVGITIDEGFMKPDVFIGISYIKNFGIDSVFLNRVPTNKFKSLEVVDSDGNPVGVVKDVKSSRHKIEEMIITKGAISRQRFVIRAKDIEEIGDVVVLKKGRKPKELA